MENEKDKIELIEDDEPNKKYKFPWGALIFGGIILVLMIVCIIVIVNIH